MINLTILSKDTEINLKILVPTIVLHSDGNLYFPPYDLNGFIS